ncbi:hypothetical protein M3Y99_00419600 [Aphelenchoides fujianensis]|nr:hypothetical protein M3Y99_00419600 [Aphelenchoides fujianensis]
MSQNPNNGGGDASADSLGSDIVKISKHNSLDSEFTNITISSRQRESTAAEELGEVNSRYRSIVEDAGQEYGADAKTEKELEPKRQAALKIRNEQLLKSIKTIALACNVDLCFVVDATGSMKCYIDGVKDAIREVPAHGKHFHNDDYTLSMDGWPDRYPNGDPSGLTADGIFERISEKGIDYYFGKITEHTNTMIKAFETSFCNQIEQFDIKDVLKISSSVISAVSESVSNAMSDSGRSSRPDRVYTLDSAVPDWSALEVHDGTFLTYQYPNSVHDVLKNKPLKRFATDSARIQIAANPFAKGGERLVYYGRDLESNEDVVLKEYIRLYKPEDTAHRHEVANKMQVVAEFFAMQFMDACEEKMRAQIPATLEFLPVKTLLLGPTAAPRCLTYEEFLGHDVRYVRFTNNSKGVMHEADAQAHGISVEMLRFVVAFSHYTYTVSKGKLMVVDLQGVVKPTTTTGGRPTVVLTDPAIHSEDPTRFASTNLTNRGMSYFFESHRCNEFCAALGLPKVDPVKLIKA